MKWDVINTNNCITKLLGLQAKITEDFLNSVKLSYQTKEEAINYIRFDIRFYNTLKELKRG